MFDNLFALRRDRLRGWRNIGQTGRNDARPARTPRRWPGAMAASAGLLSIAAAAHANNQVQVEVRGVVEKECSISGENSTNFGFDLGDLSKPGTKEIIYNISCNSPFKYAIMSDNGGLKNQDVTVAPHGFTSHVSYNISVYVPTDDIIINDHCSSDSIKVGQVACQFTDSHNGIAIDKKLLLTMDWIARETLLSGRYSDKISFYVVPKT